MPKNKTTETGNSVVEFINTFTDTDQKRKDSFELLELMGKVVLRIGLRRIISDNCSQR